MSEEPPEELQVKMKHDPRYYLRNHWRHPNDPRRGYDFRNDDEEPLYYLTDDDSPLNPSSWADVNILNLARGCLKTTTVVGIANWATDMYPVEVVASAPRQDQVSEIADRFKNSVEESGLTNRRERDRVSHQKFAHNIEGHKAYSHFKTRSAWGDGDALRGLHSHVGIIDEFQDVDEGTFSTFLEAIDQTVPDVDFFPTIFVIGTPKMKSSLFHDLWQMSNQASWDNDNYEWVEHSEVGEWGEGDESYTVKGWHIDQYNSPLHDKARIEFKKENYSQKKFANEVLAKFYSPENELLTKQDIQYVEVDDSFYGERQYPENESTVSMGIDWGGDSEGTGGSKTVIVVQELFNDEFTYLNVDFVGDMERSELMSHIEQMMNQYEVDVGCFDYGFGSDKIHDFQEGNAPLINNYKDKVTGCIYGNVKRADKPTWGSDKRIATVDRSHMCEAFVNDFKDKKYKLPTQDLDFSEKNSNGTLLYNHLTEPYKDYTSTPSGKNKLRIVSDRNDDAFHASVYAWIGAKKLVKKRTLTDIRARTRGV